MNSSHRRSGRRSTVAVVAGVALAAALTACGDDSPADTASDPATSSSPSSPSQTPSPTESDSTADSGAGSQGTIPATGSAGVTEATLVSATEGGGSASTLAFALDTDQAVADFTAQLEANLADPVAAAAAGLRAPGSTPYGATVSIGCDAPRGVAIDAGEAGFEVVPKLPKTEVQCLAPVTYVVLFAAPDA